MSDDRVLLVPEDPHFIPEPAKQSLARDRLVEIALGADVKLEVCETVQFFDCGANFIRILCRHALVEIPVNWRQDRMDEDFDDGFNLARYRTPCCGVAVALHELHYESPQAFGRFALEAMNPNIGKLDDSHHREFEEILGTKLRVVYQHI